MAALANLWEGMINISWQEPVFWIFGLYTPNLPFSSPILWMHHFQHHEVVGAGFCSPPSFKHRSHTMPPSGALKNSDFTFFNFVFWDNVREICAVSFAAWAINAIVWLKAFCTLWMWFYFIMTKIRGNKTACQMMQHRSTLAKEEASWPFNRAQNTTADVQNRQSYDKFTDIIDYENHFVAVSNRYRVIVSYWLMLKL